MSLQAVLLPLFVEVILTFVLMLRMGALRRADYNSGAIKADDVALREPRWPARTTQAANAFANQFELPVLFYTRTQEYLRGAKGEIAVVSYESPAAEDETWDGAEQKPEWFYIVRFNLAELWHGYTGPSSDTLQTEIPERWLQSAD